MSLPAAIFWTSVGHVSFSVWDLCRVQRSRGKGVHWPTQLSMRIAPGPATRASGFRQRSADAALRRNLKKAKKGFGPLAAGGSPDAPGRTGRMSERWPRATGSEHHRVMHCCTKPKMKKRMHAHQNMDFLHVCKPAWWGTDNTGTPGTRH